MAFWKNEGEHSQPAGPTNTVQPGQQAQRVNPLDVTTGNTDVLEGSELVQLRLRVAELQRLWEAEHAEVLDLRASADLHHRMMERARELWQAAHPEQADRWPDGARNVAWLVEELERVGAMQDSDRGCRCQACGRSYRIDLNVPDELWDRIRPQGKEPGAGLLCGRCIMDRAEALGEYGVLHASADDAEAASLLARLNEKCLDYDRGLDAAQQAMRVLGGGAHESLLAVAERAAGLLASGRAENEELRAENDRLVNELAQWTGGLARTMDEATRQVLQEHGRDPVALARVIVRARKEQG